jgi:glycerol-3-phosphate acyltransferase PlsX
LGTDQTMLPIAIDAMGGDKAPATTVAGAIRAVRAGIPVLLVGDEARLRPLLPKGVDVPIHHAGSAVGMDESPSAAVRAKKDASVRVAARCVAEGKASAVVSFGNTGALMAACLMELGRIEGVERPAVLTTLPRSDGGQLVVLDLGANVDCKPSHLGQFAVMGHVFARDVLHIEVPRVGLLSNGEEESKGNDQVRAALPVLAAMPIHFIGPVEPTDALSGGCEVVVCDGFVGNVMLKSVEAAIKVAGVILKEEILRRPDAKLGARLLRGAFRRYRARTSASGIGGAHLVGVEGTVLVGHGGADARAVYAAIRRAHAAVEEGLTAHIGEAISATLVRSQQDDT